MCKFVSSVIKKIKIPNLELLLLFYSTIAWINALHSETALGNRKGSNACRQLNI